MRKTPQGNDLQRTHPAIAAQWAYEEGITSGANATTFSPDDPCTRGQMVTFLYRYLVE